MKRMQIFMNTCIYLDLSILEISNQFWYNYVKLKYGARIKLHGYWQLYSVHKKRTYSLKHCKTCWNKISDTNYELDRTLSKGKNKKLLD